MESQEFEHAVRQTGEQIFKALEKEDGGSLFRKDTWYRKIMDWSMKNEHFKTQMFRFVDVLPYLQSSAEISKHLKEYFAESGGDLPPIFNFGLGLGSLAPGLMAGAVKKNVLAMAKIFITGESPADARPVLLKARAQKITFTADLLGEATLSEKEAANYLSRYIDLIKWLSEDALNWETIPQIDHDELGPIPKVNVSVKVTALSSQIDEAAWEPSLIIAKARVRDVFRVAMEHNVFINLDMEQYAHKDFIRQVFEDLVMEEEFSKYRHWGIVVQAYLRDSIKDIERLIALAKRRGTPFTIRLVKGAYWDYETVQARQKGWAIPVYLNKRESDQSFEHASRLLLDAYPHVRLALGSHNVRSISNAIAYAQSLRLDPRAFEVQMLFGMADSIKRTLVAQGYRVREYATIGELIPGMAYLVRRLLENTSNESFLRSKFSDNVSTDVLLKNPLEGALDPAKDPAKDSARCPTPDEFLNEPPTDFAISAERDRMEQALIKWKAQLNKTYLPVINGQEVTSARFITRENPSLSLQIVGKIGLAEIKDAEDAVGVAKAAQVLWQQLGFEARARLLEKLADRLTIDKAEFRALQILEVGKSWREADGDVAEAIDFCRYYARDMRRIGVPKATAKIPGEDSVYEYQPRGVTLVIAPWNFPLAILTGMVTAALVTGNAVIMKPAEQSSITASELARCMREVGFPVGVIAYLPGLGEEIGAHLVDHRDISVIAFTGSKEVGLKILRQAAVVQNGQRHIKRVIAELGGKNAIVIDSDADLDEAVQGVLTSAFGYQGQKCSACSRVIILEPLYERFCERLIEAARSLHIGPSNNPRNYLGPVIDREAAERIQQTIAKAKETTTVLFEGAAPGGGFFVAPTIFRDVDPESDLAQNEIFGPVLALIKAQDLDHALAIANSTEYALTGSLYSRSPASIARSRREFMVGNLYINRGSTGAQVGRHPFGGFKMSGVGSKAGGPDYLIQFMEPRVVTENTMRRGFVPELPLDVPETKTAAKPPSV